MRLHTGILFVSIAGALALAACGGGGGGTGSTGSQNPPAIEQANVIDRYVGTWTGCVADGAGSLGKTYEITRKADDVADLNTVVRTFGSMDCSGESIGQLRIVGEIQAHKQTKVVDGVTADKVTVLPMDSYVSGQMTVVGNPLQSFQQVVTLIDGKLREGDLDTVGTDGYPDHLTANGLTQQ